MSGRHIAISTWLQALDLLHYLPVFSTCTGVEDLLYASEAEIRELGVKNGAHRAKMVSSLCILRDKYEKGRSAGHGMNTGQQLCPQTSPMYTDVPAVTVSPEQLQQDLQQELASDPSELRSRAWYHGSITRQHAESLIQNPGDFLVRDSISKPGESVLTCWWRGQPLHFVINALVRDCAPGSLPSIGYQLEEESFGSIQDLIHFYLSRQKPVTVASGAVLGKPVARSMPLSYYDAKYGSGLSADNGVYYTSTHTPSLTTRPGLWAVRRTESQPLLAMDDGEVRQNRSPSLERFGSLPVINIIPPGGPGYVNGPQASDPTLSPRHRMGSEPEMAGKGSESSHAQGSGNDHPRSPPPKPSRVPSVKYKQRPVVAVRSPHLFEDDGRDYTDLQHVSSTPSSAGDLPAGDSSDPQSPHSPAGTCRSQSFQGSGSREVYDNVNVMQRGYQTLPLRSKAPKNPRPRLSSDSNYMDMDKSSDTCVPDTALDNQDNVAKDSVITDNVVNVSKDNVNTDYVTKDNVINVPKDKDVDNPQKVTLSWPAVLVSRIRLDDFPHRLFPAADNRLLDPAALSKAKSLILASNARAIADHMTKVDLHVLRVVEGEDFGVGVTSGIELCTLPQGEIVRDDAIEKWQCQRLLVMTSLMTCPTAGERAQMLSQWIQTAGELRDNVANLYSFTAIMEALTAPQVQRLGDTWMTLRQKQTSSAFLFDTKLRPALKTLRAVQGTDSLTFHHLTLPDLYPVVHLLHRTLDDLSALLSWEATDRHFGLDFLLPQLNAARDLASHAQVFSSAATRVLQEMGGINEELEEVFRPEFQLRLMWGSKGASAPRAERLSKFQQLLSVLSDRLEPPGDSGTAL